MEKSKIYSWSSNDLVRSVITSVFVAIVATIYGVTSQGNFDLFTADWSSILKLVVNGVFLTFVGRMGEKFVTDKDGKVFGKVG